MKRFLTVCMMILGTVFYMTAQNTVRGKVVDGHSGEGLIGASILVVGTGTGTVTDINGDFSVNVAEFPAELEISYTGFAGQKVTVNSADAGEIKMQEGISLDQVVVTGTRGKPRTILTSPVPIDNINAAELRSSGQRSIEQMINYKVPSYNSAHQAISDATAHFDPSELRNLGPSRTLVLVNGKRKNQSALVYVNDTPGKGEVGVDMKSVPAASIKRIEVLRDGASAQYGSDAIAGVINIILKDRPSPVEVNLETGITTAGDGVTYSADVHKGFSLGKTGFLNLTASQYHQDPTNRAGEPGGDGLFGVIFGDETILNGTHPWLQENPDMGMTIGQAEIDKYSFSANLGLPYGGGKGEFYAFGAYTNRDGKSFALYRAPYWITDDSGLLTPPGETYQGFQPTFETTVNDVTFNIGNKYNFNGWNLDVSLGTGSNNVDYFVRNSINVALGANSPTEFDPGGYKFDHLLANIDLTRTFGKLSVAFGSEIRQENFEVRAGQEESYIDGGVQSFPGLQPGNALTADRNNIGVYGTFDYDVNEDFLVAGAVRFENYSDFGSNVSWKLATRYLLGGGKGAVRASVNTGFRAPSLHQIYLSNIQTLVSGGTVSNQGTFNNVSPEIQALGIPALDAETSLNFAGGLTYKLTDAFSLSLDYYNIDLNDRVLFSGEVGFDGDDATNNPVEEILIAQNVTSIKFFVNALDTKTQGFDFVANYSNISLGASSDLDLVLALNWNQTEIDGTITAPGTVGEAGYDIFSRKEQSRVTTARPNFKTSFGMNFNFGKFDAFLNNTYFGEVTWQHADDPNLDQTFSGKTITDLILSYELHEQISFNLTVNVSFG